MLNSEVDIPVVLKDVCAATSPNLRPLNELALNATRGPPGKFYKGEAAFELVGALRAGGSCARVALEEEDNKFKVHYERFQNRLNDGELVRRHPVQCTLCSKIFPFQFVSMVGENLIVFCSSKNAALGAKLGMPHSLLGPAGNVLVTEVVIEDDVAYIDAVMKADTGRW